MTAFVFYFFVAYLVYKLIFNFILPVYRTTRQLKRTFRGMQQAAGTGAGASEKPSGGPVNKPASDDYIDFEEVKVQ